MRRSLLILAMFLAVVAGCSDNEDGSTSDTTGGSDATADTTADDTSPDTGADTPTSEVTSGEADTAGLKAYLDESYPDAGYSSEISIMTIGDSTTLVNLQTSFFEPDEAVALCEAVVAYLDGAGVTGPVEFVSTSGSDVAIRASADAACEPGADL